MNATQQPGTCGEDNACAYLNSTLAELLRVVVPRETVEVFGELLADSGFVKGVDR